MDPKLGTLVLGTGFTVQEAPTLPPNVYTVERHGNLASSPLYALGTATSSSFTVGIFPLGTWPTLSQGTSFQNQVSPADIGGTTFNSNFLVSDGTSLLTGYVKPGITGPGSVLVFTPGTTPTATWVNAPGNYSATSVANRFIINGGGIQTTTGTAIYALNGSGTPSGTTLATFDSSWAAASGYTASTSNGVLITGYYGTATPDGKNHLIAVPPSTYLGPLSAGTNFSLTGNLDFYSGFDVFNTVGFKDGVAVQRGTYVPPTYDAVTKDIVRFPLTLSGSGVQTVTAGTMETVLTAPNRCTGVGFISHLGDDLLVAVADRNGLRLVRLTKP